MEPPALGVFAAFNLFVRASSKESGPEVEEASLEKGLAASVRGVMEGVGWRLYDRCQRETLG